MSVSMSGRFVFGADGGMFETKNAIAKLTIRPLSPNHALQLCSVVMGRVPEISLFFGFESSVE